jgi:plastocyanin
MRLHRFVLPLAVLAAVGVLAAGCTGGGGSSEPVATTEVEMVKSYRFEPRVIEVDAGATVVWTNDDNFTHTVQVEGKGDHEVEPGGSVEIVFDEPGTYDYVCTLHRRDMDGTVIVT